MLRPLDEEQAELNKERATLVARLMVPSKPAAALSLIRMQAKQGPTLLQWRRSAALTQCPLCRMPSLFACCLPLFAVTLGVRSQSRRFGH